MESSTFDGSTLGDGTADGSGNTDARMHQGRQATADQRTAVQEGPDKAPGQASSRRKTVLVVDDDEALRVMVGLLLRTSGFRVLLAGTSSDALRICKRLGQRIDLLITDIQLPGSSGFELAAAFAAARPTVPILFISGALAEQDSELQIQISPGRDFLAKPFTPAILETKVESMLVVTKEVQGPVGHAPHRLRVLEAC